MAEVLVPNGTHPPETPKKHHAHLALTEYTAQPSPPCSTPREKTEHAGVPSEYLLPTGYPDVRLEWNLF
jgi:threonine dehydratase